MKKKRVYIFVALLIFIPTFLLALEPDEILEDVELENRARLISRDLRCLVCQNENIDSSNSELARDLRLLVRERLVLGDSDAEVISYIVNRYGDFVLLKPRFSGASLILWCMGPAVLFSSIFILLLIHGRKNKQQRIENFILDQKEEKELVTYFKNR